MKHELKIKTRYFEQVANGNKPFEIRNNIDRDFQKGDQVLLREVTDSGGAYTKWEILVEITYVTGFMQPSGQVVFGFGLLSDINASFWSDRKKKK